MSNRVYVVVEMERPSNGEKEITTTSVFAKRVDAERFLHERYDAARLRADSGVGEMDADYFKGSGYTVVDNDGYLMEGYMSNGIPLEGDEG